MTKSVVQLRQKETKGENTYVQDYQWCGCPLCGSVCVRNDYGKYVKAASAAFSFSSCAAAGCRKYTLVL
jgi:hypothetical protein